MMKRSASAVWSGDLKGGRGAISTASNVLKDTPYSFATRFENGAGTNPEELIAAAHAGCFTMQLSALIGGAGHTATRLHTTAKVHLEKDGPGFAIPLIELALEGSVPGMDAASFEKLAEQAKASCPVSKALAGPKTTLTVKFV